MSLKQQRKLERKKKKREKIRSQHLAQCKNSEEQHMKSLLSRPTIISPDSIPDRNDREGWERINAFRNIGDVFKKAEQLYPDNKLIKQYYNRLIGPNEKDKQRELQNILTHAAQAICCKPPYFIPYMQFQRYEIMPLLYAMEFRRLPDENAWHCKPRHEVVIDKVPYQLVYSSHALERLYERTRVPKSDMHASLLFIRIVESFIIEQSTYPEMVAYVNKNPNLTFLLGINKPFGYSPITIRNGRAIAKTFLLPGMQKTPEGEMYGSRMELENITDLSDYFEKCQQLGIITFAQEAKEALELLKKRRA